MAQVVSIAVGESWVTFFCPPCNLLGGGKEMSRGALSPIPPSYAYGVCDIPPDINCTCSRDYHPVCTKDGRTLPNDCIAMYVTTHHIHHTVWS